MIPVGVYMSKTMPCGNFSPVRSISVEHSSTADTHLECRADQVKHQPPDHLKRPHHAVIRSTMNDAAAARLGKGQTPGR